MAIFETVTNIVEQQDIIRRRAYGVIETANGKLVKIRFRPWPKIISLLEISALGMRTHHHNIEDRCLLYFNQPMFHRNFIAVPYVLSSAKTSYATTRIALHVLDQIAFLKRTDAIVCEVTNHRISDRAMQRFGWESHVRNSSRRHFIRRFYGEYPEAAKVSDNSLTLMNLLVEKTSS